MGSNVEPSTTAAGFDAAVVVYLILWLLIAWFSAYSRHLRQTVRLVSRKLNPEMPSGVRLDLTPPWFVRYGAVENLLMLAGLAYGLAFLGWPWILIGFGLFLFLLLPLSSRFLTPHPGAWHYLRQVRRLLQIGLAESEQGGNRERAQLYRIALERVDKGL